MKLNTAAAWRLRVRSTYGRRQYSASKSVPLTVPAPGEARLRFAPSPTGYLHLGGLRTALFNHLLARKWKGKWVLRIEDTDRARLVDGSVGSLRRTLDWAGLDYDEGVGIGGSHGPYTQSERLDIYHHHTRHLLSTDKAYECFCTADELQSIRASLHKQGQRHTYDGRCRHLTDEERGRRKKAGIKYVVRFKADTAGETLPPDLIHGDVQFPAQSMPDDVVLLKSDGYPTYHLASVVDDHEMRISHVLRGEEWLPSLPKHHALYRAFGWAPPQFAHLPLLVNADGTKLSKRTGDVRVDAYREKGYEPEALLNFLALMGWDHHSALAESAAASASASASASTLGLGSSEGGVLPDLTRSDSHSYYDLFTIPQLTRAFSLEHVNTKKAAVNLSKLDFINKLTLRRKAGRLGEDGHMVEFGKHVGDGATETESEAVVTESSSSSSSSSSEAESESARRRGKAVIVDGSEEARGLLIDRVQESFKSQKVLSGNSLVEDRSYIEKVFDAEMPRTVILNDLAPSAIFFFLTPEYDTHEAVDMIKGLNPQRYVTLVEDVLQELKIRLSSTMSTHGQGVEEGEGMTEDIAWRAIYHIVRARNVSKKQELLTPMRHALTGRTKGPGVPAIMQVLGAQRSLYRLERALEFVRLRIREQA